MSNWVQQSVCFDESMYILLIIKVVFSVDTQLTLSVTLYSLHSDLSIEKGSDFLHCFSGTVHSFGFTFLVWSCVKLSGVTLTVTLFSA